MLVTVGMSRWPFDRLVREIDGIDQRHEVFAQIGVARHAPRRPHARFVPMPELLERMREADVVVTHAGNSLRLVQRLGAVPIAVARDPGLDEAANEHQIEYLRHEEREGRVVALWDVTGLPAAVEEHEVRSQSLRARPVPEPVPPHDVCRTLDAVCRRLLDDPFARGRRSWSYAWRALCDRGGRHLDVGAGRGEFVRALARTTALDCHAVCADPGCVERLRRDAPGMPVAPMQAHGLLPYPDGTFDSASLLDVLAEAPSERAMLAEVRRVLAPGGLAVVTRPRRRAGRRRAELPALLEAAGLPPLDVGGPDLERAVALGGRVFHAAVFVTARRAV